MNNQINIDAPGWKDLPEHVKREFDETFEKNDKIIKLKRDIQIAQQTKQWVLELNLRKKLSEVRLKAQENLLANQEDSVEEVSLLQMGLSHEALDKINTLIIAMYLASDMLEFFAIDINSELKKADPSASFEMFDPIREVGKKARENLSYLWKKTSMYDTEDFNNNADDIRAMLINKAKKVYVKYAKRVAEKEAKQKK